MRLTRLTKPAAACLAVGVTTAGAATSVGHGRIAWATGRSLGALRLELTLRSARWRFVRVDGRVLDAGRLPCRRPAR